MRASRRLHNVSWEGTTLLDGGKDTHSIGLPDSNRSRLRRDHGFPTGVMSRASCNPEVKKRSRGGFDGMESHNGRGVGIGVRHAKPTVAAEWEHPFYRRCSG